MRHGRAKRADWELLTCHSTSFKPSIGASHSNPTPLSTRLPVATHVGGGTQRALQQLRWAIWKIKPLPVSDQEN